MMHSDSMPLRAAAAAHHNHHDHEHRDHDHHLRRPVKAPASDTATTMNTSVKKMFLVCSMVCLLTVIQYQTGVSLARTMTDQGHDIGILPELSVSTATSTTTVSISVGANNNNNKKRNDARALRGQSTDESEAYEAEQEEYSLEEEKEEYSLEEEDSSLEEEESSLEEEEEDENGSETDAEIDADADSSDLDEQGEDQGEGQDEDEKSSQQQQQEQQQPLHTTTSNNNNTVTRAGTDTLSSCLMVMDDNHRLTEWIAYHYFVMNLRHLVILSDPRSRFSPTLILDKWRQHTNMTITEWTEQNYMDADFAKRSRQYFKKNDTQLDRRMRQQYHMERQAKFIKQCSLHMQRTKNTTWVSFHDIDEYYVINSEQVANAADRMSEPGSVLTLLHQIQSQQEPFDTKMLHSRTGLGRSRTGRAALEHVTGPCVTTYRTPYGAVPSPKQAMQRNVPDFVDPVQFETLKWRHHQVPGYKSSQIGKSLIDVSRVPDLKNMDWPDRERFPFSPHRLVPICPEVHYHPKAFIRINHYVGSWENYSFRTNDGRKGGNKNRKAWETKSNIVGGLLGDEARPWVQGFVNLMGIDGSKILLADAGLPANYTAPVDLMFIPQVPKRIKSNSTRRPRKKTRTKKKKLATATTTALA
jgi:hypothetical protein